MNVLDRQGDGQVVEVQAEVSTNAPVADAPLGRRLIPTIWF